MLGKTTERKQKTTEPSEERKGELLEFKKSNRRKTITRKEAEPIFKRGCDPAQ